MTKMVLINTATNVQVVMLYVVKFCLSLNFEQIHSAVLAEIQMVPNICIG